MANDTKQALKELQKDFGPKVFAGDEVPPVDVLSTGSISLDFATGVGGIPLGTIVEIFGPESIGKTTLSYYMIAEAQRQGHHCAFINLEGKFNAEWAQKIAGVNLANLIVGAPSPGSETLELIAKIIDKGVVRLIVLDSIGAMLDDGAQEIGGSNRVGGQSQLVTHMITQSLVPAAQNNVSLVLLNQVRDIMGIQMSAVESPGGHALKHAAVFRIQLKPTRDKFYGIVDGDKKEIGYRVTAFFKKNKMGSPKKIATWNFFHDEVDGVIGIDRSQEVVDLALKLGVMERNGSRYAHPSFPGDSNSLAGKSAIGGFLKENPEAFESIRKELMQRSGKE